MTSKLFCAPFLSFVLAVSWSSAEEPSLPDEPPQLKKKEKPKPPQEQPADKAKAPQKKKDLKEQDEPIAPDKDPKEILARVTGNMRVSEGRLEKKDAGEGTRQVQRDILKDLDALIEQTKKNQCSNCLGSSSTSSSGKSSRQSRGRSQSADKRGNQDDQADEEERKSRQAGEQSAGNRAGAGGKSKQDKSKIEDLYKDLWGHLPETLRQEMNAYSREKFMMKYQDLLKHYYATLAEKGKNRER